MITKDIKVANAIKTLAETCREHKKCCECPLYHEASDACFIDFLKYCSVEYVQVKQHGDNEYFISIG